MHFLSATISLSLLLISSITCQEPQQDELEVIDGTLRAFVGTQTYTTQQSPKNYSYGTYREKKRTNSTITDIQIIFCNLDTDRVMSDRKTGEFKITKEELLNKKVVKNVQVQFTPYETGTSPAFFHKYFANIYINSYSMDGKSKRIQLGFTIKTVGQGEVPGLSNSVIEFKEVDFYARKGYFRLFFMACCLIQFVGIIKIMNKAKDNLEEYMSRYSFFGLLSEMVISSAILYHFGVLLPVDFQCIIPCVMVMFNLTLVWMAKFIQTIHNRPALRSRMRPIQIFFTIFTVSAGLYLPSADTRSYAFLGVILLPIVLQIAQSMRTGKVSGSYEYFIEYKLPQIAIISYIFGWPNPVHLLPTHPKETLEYLQLVVILYCLVVLQNYYHPRLFFWKIFEKRLMAQRAQKVSIEELEGFNDEESDRNYECSICIMDFTNSDGTILRTPCKHLFHTDCLTVWLEKHENCPVCRAKCLHHDPTFYS